MTMTRRLVAPLLAAAIAVTPMAASPARANDDLAKALLGALVIYGIAKGVQAQERRDDRRVERRADDRHGWQKGGPRGRIIPAQCVRRVDWRRGTTHIVPERCLEREGFRNLPDRCAISISGPGSRRDVYGLSCLQQAGYRVEGWRR